MRIPSFIQHPINSFRQGQLASWKRYQELCEHIDTKRGFFVEAGANDGIKQSNTYGLERWGGWNGLLIEAIPRLAELCEKQRKVPVYQAALVASDFPEETIKLVDCDLMSFVLGSAGDEEYEAQQIEESCKSQSIKAEEIVVRAQSLTSIFESHNIEKIDLLSLDVEGYEPQVLNGLDFERFAPRYLLIENGHRPEVLELITLYTEVTTFENGDGLFRLT